MAKKTETPSSSYTHTPVVTVLGHVDHGKTTLLDTIRKTSIALRETGGITQSIGAYQVQPKNTLITFIDTPGHEAFKNMRAQGASVADIAILVVAANDGVQPQTLESIKLIQNSKLPVIVALNKIDMPGIQIEKIKKQLSQAGIVLEEYGGETPIVPLSAKSGQGVEKLLETISFLAEFHQIQKDIQQPVRGTVIESSLTKQRGATATIILQQGTLHVGDTVHTTKQSFRIRALQDWKGQSVKEIKAGDPALVLGWQKVPSVGSIIESSPLSSSNPGSMTKNTFITSIDSGHIGEKEQQVKIILKTDTTGSLEAILNTLQKNRTLIFIDAAVGPVRESDVLMAKTTGSIILSFNQPPPDPVTKLAHSEKVIIKEYAIIYELFDELSDLIEAIRQGNLVTIIGEAKILAFFPFDGKKVAGIKVTSGRIARGDNIKIMRGSEEIGRTRISSLRHKKDTITKAEEGTEAGALFSHPLDVLTGDSIIAIG